MHALLMTSAEHLQYLYPDSREDYSLQVAYHLQQSLRDFRIALSGDIASISNNIDAIIGTSFLLITHGWANPQFSYDSDIQYNDPLLQHSNGIFEIYRRTHDYGTSAIFDVICTPKLLPPLCPTDGPALDLIFMVTSQLPGDQTLEVVERTYVVVIESLTPIMDTVSSRPKLDNTPPSAFLVYLVQWLAFLPPTFMALVEQRDSRALIIMAYYYAAVVVTLKKTTGWWWMRERPVYMIKQTANFLDEKWDIWMRWPLQMLEKVADEDDRSTVVTGNGRLDQGRAYGGEMGILSERQLHFRKIQVEE